MNQILYTGGKNKKGGSGSMQKIIIFFAIFVIAFAICAILIGTNLLSKVKNEDNLENEILPVMIEKQENMELFGIIEK